MSRLSEKKCEACATATAPMGSPEVAALARELGGGWQVIRNHHLEKLYKFPDFKEALAFTNRVGEVAEEEGHHPDIHLTWGKVRIEIFTHKVDGLTEADFVLAAKLEDVAGKPG